MRRLLALALGAALTALAVAPSAALARATITIINANDPGVGFNDPTPAAPLPSNPGTTVGQQRLEVFEFAAAQWGAVVDSPVEIFVLAAFLPRPCTATSGVLGSAGATTIFSDFPGAVFPGTWYPSALADKLAGEDLDPTGADIVAVFNSEVGQTGCLEGASWYYGLDTNHGATEINLATVLLHEFAHGLGFQSFVNTTTGARPLDLIDVYSLFYFDLLDGLPRSAYLTDAERAASARHYRDVVWIGPHTRRATRGALDAGSPALDVEGRASGERRVAIGTALFGPALTPRGVEGRVVLGLDAAGTSLGCAPFANAADLRGRVVLVDRGACTFTAKTANAQAAGARAVIVADNAPGGPPPGLGGADPTLVIPAVRVTLRDGAALKADLAAVRVEARLWLDPGQLLGADRNRQVFLNATDPVQPGSSISHWDPLTSPSQLMEPFINDDLTLEVTPPQDLTSELLRDLGWFTDRNLDGRPDFPGEVVRRPRPER
jgi:hypothetical protein